MNVGGKLETRMGPHKKNARKNKWESSIHLQHAVAPGVFPKTRFACRDLLRRAKLRLA